jgi:hypothetical protein
LSLDFRGIFDIVKAYQEFFMKHILPTDIINKVLNYLAGRPYSEVAVLVKDIQSNAVQHQEASCDAVPVVEAVPE